MSFILDALRKSERDRQAGKVPGLPSLALESAPKTPRWVYWLVGVLLLSNLSGLGFWLYRQQQPQGESREEVASSEPKEAPIVPSVASLKADQSPPKEAPIVSPAPPPVLATPPQNPPVALPPAPLPAPAPPPVAVPPPLPRTTPLVPPRPSVSRQEGRRPADEDEIDREMENETGIPDMAALPLDSELVRPHPGRRPGAPALRDLPADFQSRVPNFRITMFAYAERPEERFVIINMKKLKVGDLLPGGILLIDIEAEHLVAELDGQKFLIPRY